MNGNDVLEFEEFYHEELVDEYMKSHGNKEPDEESQEWHDFVLRAMSDHMASAADYMEERWEDEQGD